MFLGWIYIKKYYFVIKKIDCDPFLEKCFIYKCDSNSKEKKEACDDIGDGNWYYKIVKRQFSKCNKDIGKNCFSFQCGVNEKDCIEILCDEKNKFEQKAECNDPEKYTLAHSAGDALEEFMPNNQEDLEVTNEEEYEEDEEDCSADDQECQDESEDTEVEILDDNGNPVKLSE